MQTFMFIATVISLIAGIITIVDKVQELREKKMQKNAQENEK